jgi:hypothetical protein
MLPSTTEAPPRSHIAVYQKSTNHQLVDGVYLAFFPLFSFLYCCDARIAMSRPALPKYSYTFSTLAYALPLLHAARYPSSTTVGLLLGRPSSSPSTSTSESSTASPIEVSVEDAIPLLHHYTSLSAMMEVTLQLVAEYVGMKGAGGWRVVGYYEARVEGEGLSRSGERVLRALREEWEGVFALVVSLPWARRCRTFSRASVAAPFISSGNGLMSD